MTWEDTILPQLKAKEDLLEARAQELDGRLKVLEGQSRALQARELGLAAQVPCQTLCLPSWVAGARGMRGAVAGSDRTMSLVPAANSASKVTIANRQHDLLA